MPVVKIKTASGQETLIDTDKEPIPLGSTVVQEPAPISPGLGSLRQQDEKNMQLTRENVRDNPGLVSMAPGNPIAPAPKPVAAPMPQSNGQAPQQQEQDSDDPAAQPAFLSQSKTEQNTAVSTTKTLPTKNEAGLNKERQGLVKQNENNIRTAGALDQKEAGFRSETADKYNTLADQQLKDLEALQANERTARAAVERQQADRVKKYEDFQFKDYWSDRSTATKIAAAIAVGAGAYAASVGKTENYAAKIIESAVEQDFRKQQAELGKLDKAVAMGKDLTDAERAKWQDLKLDLATKQKYAWDSVGRELESKIAKLGPARATAAMNGALTLAAQKSNENAQKIEESLRDKVTTTATSQTTSQVVANPKAEVVVQGYKQVGNIKLTDTEKQEARKIKSTYDDMVKGLDTIKKLVNENGTEMGGATGEKMKGQVAALKLKAKTLFALGALSESDYDIMDAIIKDPTSWWNNLTGTRKGTFAAGYDTAKENFKASYDTKMDSYGLAPVQEKAAAPQGKDAKKSWRDF